MAEHEIEGGVLQRVRTEEEFVAELQEIVGEQAPAVFALCEEIGDRYCGQVEYWGMAFDDHAEVVRAAGGERGSFRSAESAHRLFSVGHKLHLLWV